MSDLKITHAGTEVQKTNTGPINPLATLGQAGSVFTNTATAPLIPPAGKSFVAITFIGTTKFNTTTGLVAEDPSKFISEDASAHSAVSVNSDEGTGGLPILTTTEFPAGLTIYGRWTKIQLAAAQATDGIIAYIG